MNVDAICYEKGEFFVPYLQTNQMDNEIDPATNVNESNLDRKQHV